MCNQTPPTPACSISPDRDIVPSLPSSLSRNSRAVYYGDTAAMYGQAQQCANIEEEEVAPKDSTSTRVSPTHGITNSLDVLALVRNKTLTKEDMVIDHTQPEGFKVALQSFQEVQAKLDGILADDSDGKLNMSCQLGQRMAKDLQRGGPRRSLHGAGNYWPLRHDKV